MVGIFCLTRLVVCTTYTIGNTAISYLFLEDCDTQILLKLIQNIMGKFGGVVYLFREGVGDNSSTLPLRLTLL
jgi:hypothetical protein